MSESHFSTPLEETVVIVGVGLIGGSLAAALKQRRIARRVIGVGRDLQRMRAAKSQGLIDEGTIDLAWAAQIADVIVFCTPVDRIIDGVQTVETALSKRTNPDSQRDLILTDAGSVKAQICQELSNVPRFIGSHPIAGSHRQGFEAADARLFEGKVCVLTPLLSHSDPKIRRLERFWSAVGMQTLIMSPSEHDTSLAMTSHLPHVVASALAQTLSPQNQKLVGTGFRDTTRVAAGDPDLWTAILTQNADNVCAGIEAVQRQLSAIRQAVAEHDVNTLRELLKRGQASRLEIDGTVRQED